MNHVALVGRLTKDPELRRTPSGKGVCGFSLAVDRAYKTQGQPDADFINCQAWGKTAENLCQYMRKGYRIGLTGSIHTRTYESERGRMYVTEVVADRVEFLESKKDAQRDTYQAGVQSDGYQASYQRQSYGRRAADTGGYVSPTLSQPEESYYDNFGIDSDDLPF